MDETKKTLNQQIYDEVGDPQSDPDSSTDESLTQDNTETGDQNDTQSQDSEGEESKNSSKNRIQELAADKNLAKAESTVKDVQLRSLQDHISEIEGYDPTKNGGYTPPSVKPGQELSPEEYQRHVLSTADALVDLKIQQNNNANRIKSELIESVNEYPELNPKQKDHFDNDLSTAITGAVGAFVKANPTGNVKKYIDSLMKPYQRAIEKGVGKQQENTAKQVSETAMRPTHSPKGGGEKAFKDLSISEMEKRLGKVYS